MGAGVGAVSVTGSGAGAGLEAVTGAIYAAGDSVVAAVFFFARITLLFFAGSSAMIFAFLLARFLVAGAVNSVATATSFFAADFFAAFLATFFGAGAASSMGEIAVFLEAFFLGFLASGSDGMESLMQVNRSLLGQSSCDSTASDSSKLVNTLRVSS